MGVSLAKELSRELNRVPAPLTTFGAANAGVTLNNSGGGVVSVGVPFAAIVSTGSATCYAANGDLNNAAIAGYRGGGGGGGGGGTVFNGTLNPLYHVTNGGGQCIISPISYRNMT